MSMCCIEENKRRVLEKQYKQEQPEVMKSLLIENAREISYLLTPEELRERLEVSGEPQNEDGPLYYYLWGLAQIRNDDRVRFKETMRRMNTRHRFMKAGQEKHDWIEAYLNLLYENPECSILDWIDIAEQYATIAGRIQLYSMSGNRPGICFGVKEMSGMFMKDKQCGGYYASCWRRIFGEKERGLLKIAELEYMLETNGEESVEQEINEIFISVDRQQGTADEWLGCAGIILKLQRNGQHRGEYGAVIHSVTTFLKKMGYTQALENIDAAGRIIQSINGEKAPLIKWLDGLKNDKKLQNEWLKTSTLYMKLMQARGYMNVLQYEKARICFKETAIYSELVNQTWFCVSSLFGEAAAVYEQGGHQEAMKLTAQALTMGIQYKYTGVFTEYGKTGVCLIEAYQKMVGLDNRASLAGRRKKYYYGNVMTASYEGYHSILLRKVRKEMRYGKSQEEKDRVRTTLTMTEVLILQYIANGYSNKEIGEKMNIRLTTVKTHVYSIYRKLDVSSRVMAINRAKVLNIL